MFEERNLLVKVMPIIKGNSTTRAVIMVVISTLTQQIMPVVQLCTCHGKLSVQSKGWK